MEEAPQEFKVGDHVAVTKRFSVDMPLEPNSEFGKNIHEDIEGVINSFGNDKEKVVFEVDLVHEGKTHTLTRLVKSCTSSIPQFWCTGRPRSGRQPKASPRSGWQPCGSTS